MLIDERTGKIFCTLLLLCSFLHSQSQPASSPRNEPPNPQEATVPPASSKTPDSEKLVLLKSEMPVYPAEAQQKGIQGQVFVKIFVSESGDVENVEVISGEPLLNAAAVEAVKKWQFKPFIKDGKPAQANAKVPLTFTLPSSVKIDQQNVGSTPRRVRVSQGVTAKQLIHKVNPVYPLEGKQGYVTGTVLLRVIIGTDGTVKELNVLSGPPLLKQSALDAVKQWRYKPYLLNGEPIEVETEIMVHFSMG